MNVCELFPKDMIANQACTEGWTYPLMMLTCMKVEKN
jgi:hypothetical protein